MYIGATIHVPSERGVFLDWFFWMLGMLCIVTEVSGHVTGLYACLMGDDIHGNKEKKGYGGTKACKKFGVDDELHVTAAPD